MFYQDAELQRKPEPLLMTCRTARSLAELRSQFRQIADRASAAFGEMDEAVLVRRPVPERWSAAENLMHLNLSVDQFFPIWREALTGMARTPRDNYRLDFWGRVVIWLLEPPPRFRLASAPKAAPVSAQDPPGVALREFLTRQEQMLEMLDAAVGLALDEVKMRSPFDSRVRYSIWSSFCVTAAHERRHLWQAERALAAMGQWPADR